MGSFPLFTVSLAAFSHQSFAATPSAASPFEHVSSQTLLQPTHESCRLCIATAITMNPMALKTSWQERLYDMHHVRIPVTTAAFAMVPGGANALSRLTHRSKHRQVRQVQVRSVESYHRSS